MSLGLNILIDLKLYSYIACRAAVVVGVHVGIKANGAV